MRIVICDDEALMISTLQGLIQRWKAKNNVESAAVTIYESSEELLDVLENALPFDLAFLAIQFPGELSGLQLAEHLRRTNAQMQIVFVSNYDQYAIDGYRANALRYLQKPVTEMQVSECLDISYRQWQYQQGNCVVLLDNQQAVKLDHKAILFAETQGHYVRIHLATQQDSVCIRMRCV